MNISLALIANYSLDVCQEQHSLPASSRRPPPRRAATSLCSKSHNLPLITNKHIAQQDQEAAAAGGCYCENPTDAGSVHFKGDVDLARLVCPGQVGLSGWSCTAMALGHSNLEDLTGPQQSICVGFQPKGVSQRAKVKTRTAPAR